MSSTHSQLSSVVFRSGSRLNLKLTHSVVGAAKCKFIVSLYLLGAAHGGRDYIRLPMPTRQKYNSEPSFFLFFFLAKRGNNIILRCNYFTAYYVI